MPKKKRVLTEVLYTYVKPENHKFLLASAKRRKISRSELIDTMIERARKERSRKAEARAA